MADTATELARFLGVLGSGAACPQRQAAVALTNAQVLSLWNTRVTLIAAPGANRVIVTPLYTAGGGAVVWGDWTTAYGNVADLAEFEFALGNGSDTGVRAQYMGEDGASNVENLLEWGAASGTDRPIWRIGQLAQTSVGTMLNSLDRFANLPLTLFLDNQGAGAITGGNAANVLHLAIPYYLLDVTSGLFV